MTTDEMIIIAKTRLTYIFENNLFEYGWGFEVKEPIERNKGQVVLPVLVYIPYKSSRWGLTTKMAVEFYALDGHDLVAFFKSMVGQCKQQFDEVLKYGKVVTINWEHYHPDLQLSSSQESKYVKSSQAQ